MPLDWLVGERFVAVAGLVGAAELVAGHSAGDSGADVDVVVAAAAELGLVAAHVAGLGLELANGPVVFVRHDGFAAGLVVDGE